MENEYVPIIRAIIMAPPSPFLPPPPPPPEPRPRHRNIYFIYNIILLPKKYFSMEDKTRKSMFILKQLLLNL